MRAAGLSTLTKFGVRQSASPTYPANSNSARNQRSVTLELQKARASVMDTIREEANGRGRTNQVFENNISLVSHEYMPKIHTLERQSAFAKKQVSSVMASINEIQGNYIQNVKNSYETSKLLFEQQIKQEAISKFNPISEDQRLQSTKINKLTENTVNFLSNNANEMRTIQAKYDKIERSISDFNKASMAKINEIRPRISASESKAAFLETASEDYLQVVSLMQDIINNERKCRADLNYLQEEGLTDIIGQMDEEKLTLISSKTSEIDQRIYDVETTTESLKGSLQASQQSQSQVDTQVDDISRKTMDIQVILKTDEDELLGKLVSLESQVEDLKANILERIQNYRGDSAEESKLSDEDFQENVSLLSNLSAKDIAKLQDEWTKFNENNNTAQAKANDIINDAMRKLHGSGNIVKRVYFQEERLAWCMKRIEAWEREDAKMRHIGITDTADIVEMINKFDEKIKELESGLEAVDKKEADVGEVPEIPKRTKIADIEEATADEKHIDEITLDENLVLTYPDDEPPFEPLKKSQEEEEEAEERRRIINEKRAERIKRNNEAQAIKYGDDEEEEKDEDEEKPRRKKRRTEAKEEEEEENEHNEEEEEKPRRKKRRTEVKEEEEENEHNEEEEEKPKRKKRRTEVKEEEENEHNEEEEEKPKRKKRRTETKKEEDEHNEEEKEKPKRKKRRA